MSANVRCAGNTPPVPQPGDAEVGLPDAAYGPCGWTGERMVLWNPRDGRHLLNASKPCPSCGGQVELIGALAPTKPEPGQPAIVNEVEAAEQPGAGGERP